MHEYSIAGELVELILVRLDGQDVERVEEVHLRKGELLVLSTAALEQAYQLLSAETILEGSKLVIEEAKTRVECPGCGYSGGAECHRYHFIAPILKCPSCGASVRIEQGQELELVKLVVEDGG